MGTLVSTLKDKLFDLTDMSMNNSFFSTAIKAIHLILHSTECSLWSINRNTTVGGEIKGKHSDLSTSVICRYNTEKYDIKRRTDYVHILERDLFNMVMDSANERGFFRGNRADVEKLSHQSMAFVNKFGLDDFISIPIPDRSDPEKIIALLELSFKEMIINNDECQECAKIIKSFFSTAFQRYSIYQKDELQKIYGNFNGGDIKSFFNNLINIEFRKFFDYQGASFFIWDSYGNVFRPITSTDKTIAYNDPTKAYPKDNGLTHTGWVGTTGMPSISDEISNYLWYEHIEGEPKTLMIVPIIDPANTNNVIGIVRFLNKKNRNNPDIVDFFNDIDLNLIQSYSQYLSLIIYFYNKEQDQVNLISKVAHEFKTPANAIYKSATRLLDSIEDNDEESLQKNLKSYLDDIADYANIQLWQAESTLYVTRSQQQKTKYRAKKCSLLNILSKSRSVSRPIARQEGIRFDNIKIHPQSYDNLNLMVDETAFVIVFYNLLTNAIKYHDAEYPDSFHVDIRYTVSDVAVEILVEDWGIGVEKKDKDAIFQVGYRGERAMRENSSGFGVGLSVAKQVITDFGGIISIKCLQRPTTFEILLPKTLII